MASDSTVPTMVSAVLVPTKKAASWEAGTAVPVTGSKLAASIAAPAPTAAGAKGTRRAPPWVIITSSTTSGVTGSPKAARKHASAAARHARLASCHGSTRRA